VLERFQNQFWKLHLLLKKPLYSGFWEYFVASFWSPSIGAFSVLLEDSLRIISETGVLGKYIVE
jgi:hypothetical protein